MRGPELRIERQEFHLQLTRIESSCSEWDGLTTFTVPVNGAV